VTSSIRTADDGGGGGGPIESDAPVSNTKAKAVAAASSRTTSSGSIDVSGTAARARRADVKLAGGSLYDVSDYKCVRSELPRGWFANHDYSFDELYGWDSVFSGDNDEKQHPFGRVVLLHKRVEQALPVRIINLNSVPLAELRAFVFNWIALFEWCVMGVDIIPIVYVSRVRLGMNLVIATLMILLA
jgi:hypothetical protein